MIVQPQKATHTQYCGERERERERAESREHQRAVLATYPLAADQITTQMWPKGVQGVSNSHPKGLKPTNIILHGFLIPLSAYSKSGLQ